MSENNTQTVSGSEAAAKIANGQSTRRGYNLSGVQLVAYRMEPGDSMFLSHPRIPEVKLLVQGQHFDFLPPYKGRPGDVRDATMSQFTAKVPLLVAVHGPRGRGKLTHARSLGHIRAARESAPGFGIVRELLEEIPDMLRLEPRMRYGCKDGHYPEHLSLGGPLGAVVYRDELVVPGYQYEEGVRDSLPFTYIVERAQEDLLAHAFRRGAQEAWAIREGRQAPRAVAVAGAMRTGNLGPVEVKYDAVGRCHGINDGKAKPFLSFKNGMSLRVGEIITHPAMRLELGLELLASTVVQVSPVAAVFTQRRDKLPGLPKSPRSAPAAPAVVIEPTAAPEAVEAIVEPVAEPAPVEAIVEPVAEPAPVEAIVEPVAAPALAVTVTAPVAVTVPEKPKKPKPSKPAKSQGQKKVQAPVTPASPEEEDAAEVIFREAIKDIGPTPDLELHNGQLLAESGERLSFDKAQYINEAIKAKMVYITEFNRAWTEAFTGVMKGL